MLGQPQCEGRGAHCGDMQPLPLAAMEVHPQPAALKATFPSALDHRPATPTLPTGKRYHHQERRLPCTEDRGPMRQINTAKSLSFKTSKRTRQQANFHPAVYLTVPSRASFWRVDFSFLIMVKRNFPFFLLLIIFKRFFSLHYSAFLR